MIESHEREMSISLQDFYRLLPIALKDLQYETSKNIIYISYGDGSIRIEPGNEGERKIASLALPVLHVMFTFTDILPDSGTQFLSNFSRVYQRGGG